MSRRRTQYPPRRICATCGGHFYSWSGIDCNRCVRDRGERRVEIESLRAFRQRVIEGK